MFRDWLRNDPSALRLYAAQKADLAARHADSGTTRSYAEAKEPWFTEIAWPRMDGWAARTGWQPPSYVSRTPRT
jgi:dephospho-CoA kinase